MNKPCRKIYKNRNVILEMVIILYYIEMAANRIDRENLILVLIQKNLKGNLIFKSLFY